MNSISKFLWVFGSKVVMNICNIRITTHTIAHHTMAHHSLAAHVFVFFFAIISQIVKEAEVFSVFFVLVFATFVFIISQIV